MNIKLLFLAVIVVFTMASCKTKDGVSKKGKNALQEELAAHENDSNLTFYDWNEGYAKAIRLNKILLVDVYTDWCYWCKVMDKKTYAVDDVIKQLNKDFVCVKFNPEKPNDSLKLFDTYVDARMLQAFLFDRRSSGYPTTSFWVNPSQKEKLEVYAGYKDAEKFKGILNNLLTLRKPAETATETK